MKIKKLTGGKESISSMNPHKTRREKVLPGAKGLGKMGMNKTTGSKKKTKKN